MVSTGNGTIMRPQGSISRPLLWNILCDSALRLNLGDSAHIQAYEDDFLVIVGYHNPDVLRFKANAALNTLADWSTNIKLQFCPVKTQMIFVPW